MNHRHHHLITKTALVAAVLLGSSSVDASSTTRSLQKTYETIKGRSCFRSLDGMIESMTDLAVKYPDLLTMESIGKSFIKKNNPRPSDYDMDYDLPPGYDIYAFNVTAANSARKSFEKGKMLVTSGVHPREWAPPELNARFIETLVEGYNNNADITWILDHNEIHAILYVNPDGRFISEKYPSSYWRKNLNPEGCGNGVDLNRNLDFMWGDANGASDNPCANDYHGSSPNSEPETQAVVDYAKKLFPEGQRKDDPEKEMNTAFGEDITGVYIDIHASGGFVYYPWGHKDAKSPDNEALEALGRKINYYNGYKLWAGSQPDFMYEASGDFSDYMYGALGVASFGYEIGDDFQQDCSTFEDKVVPINLPSLIYAAKIAMKPYKEVKGPDVLKINTRLLSGRVRVVANASDSKMVNSIKGFPGHSSGNQIITAVHLYLDVHPDDYKEGSDKMWDMEVLDDNWDTTEETVRYEVPTRGLSFGRHTIYVQAIDSRGYKGPVSSTFIDIPAHNSNLRGGP
eukprot:scaffold14315_cov136-Skeletonema_menzelii.AAC.4